VTDAELAATAWQVLGWAWALQWALILSAGSGPAVLSALGRKLGWLRTQHWAQQSRKWGALVAVLLCIQAAPLWLDTYNLESGEQFWKEVSCPAAITPAQSGGISGEPARSATCDHLLANAAPCGPLTQNGVSHVLAHSGKPLGVACHSGAN